MFHGVFCVFFFIVCVSDMWKNNRIDDRVVVSTIWGSTSIVEVGSVLS
jgi:hypothetical protein